MKTTGNEKLRFTVALTAGVKRVGNEFNAVRLPPMLIFKNLKKAPKGKFPTGMAVLGSKGGTMKQTFIVNTFIPKIWKRRPGGFFNTGQSLLLMDSATCHLNRGIPEALTACNTDYKYIDTGMTPLLQFLDSHINKPFKDGLKEKWQDWTDSGECEYTDAGNRRRASYTMVAEWVFDVWRKVATEDLILRGFHQCGYIGWNGDVSTLHSKLRATVESREVPNEVIEEMNAFLEEMRMAEAEEIVAEDKDTAEEQGDELDTGEEPDGIETDEEDFEDEEDIDILF